MLPSARPSAAWSANGGSAAWRGRWPPSWRHLHMPGEPWLSRLCFEPEDKSTEDEFLTPNQVRIFIYLNTTVPQPCYKLRMFLTVVNLELNTYIQVSRQSKCWLRLQQQKILCCTWRKYSDYTKTVIYFWVKYFSSTSLLGNRGCGVTYFERLHCSASESNGGQQSWWKPCLRACHSHEALAVYQEVQ